MKARTFNSLMHKYNEKWAAKVLDMQVNPSKGPDLIDKHKALEVKFEIVYPEVKAHKCWRVLGYQLDYNKIHKEIYWGLGFYNFNEKIKNIKRIDFSNIEKLVDYREIYIVNWDWINQFQLYHQKGKTNISEWDHYLCYPKFALIPKIISSQEVKDGKIFFTEGVNPEKFEINKEGTYQNTYKDVPF